LEHSEVSQERAISNQQLDGKYADNELDKANVPKDYFLHVSMYHCHLCLAPMDLPTPGFVGGSQEYLLGTEQDVMTINYTDVSKASGQDRIIIWKDAKSHCTKHCCPSH